MEHVALVLKTLAANSLVVNGKKFNFGVRRVAYHFGANKLLL